MSFIEKIFQSAFDRIRPKEVDHSDAAAFFAEYQARLAYLAGSISSLGLVCDGSTDYWGLRGNRLLLPAVVDLFPTRAENYDVLKLRLIVEVLTIMHIASGGVVAESYECESDRIGYLTAGLALREVEGFLGNTVQRMRAVALDGDDLAKRVERLLTFKTPQLSDVEIITIMLKPPNNAGGKKPGRSEPVSQKKRSLSKLKQLYLNDEDMNPLVHSFEKIKTLEDYTGGNKQIDDADETQEHGRALEDLDLNTIVRTNRTGSEGFAVAPLAQEAVDSFPQEERSKVHAFQYREWNAGKEKYQPAWCQVYEHQPHMSIKDELCDGRGASASRDASEAVPCREKGKIFQRQLMRYFNTYRWQRNQSEGVELDLPAFIDNRIEQRRGGRPSDKIYLSRVKTDLNFGLTILCDSSLSTDSWVKGNQTYKVIREAAAILGYGLNGIDIPWSLAAFNSFTRRECHYRLLKDFNDDSKVLLRNLDVIKPDGYTRIGPALRHAGVQLQELRARRNILIVVTDSKPTDYDYYDGRYGVQDVRRAVLELKAKNIHTYALTVADSPKERAVQMFGNATASCTSPDQLSHQLFDFFAKFLSKQNR